MSPLANRRPVVEAPTAKGRDDNRGDDADPIEDLGSKNGTFVEGRRTGGKPLPLADGDQIQVGSVFLTFRVRSSEKSTRTFRGHRRP